MTCASDIVPTNLKRASILTLPNEVLLRIFYEVYYASCDIRLDEESTTKLADASLFPQCLIKVCKAWKKLVRSVPRFATRIMVFVDEPISFDELRGRFEDSKTLFIKVFAIRRQYPDTYDPFEKGVTRDVVKALSPHIERCKVVVFDLLQNSSLPHMTQFSGQAPKLRTLRMQCRRSVANESTQLVSQHELLTQPSPFICPHLQYLDMHGHMFVEAVHIPQWQRSIRALSRKQLTISHLRNVPAEEFDLRKLMLTLSEIHHLTKLKLLDVELDNTTCISEASPGPIFIQNFEFEDLSRSFFTGFFAAYENAIDVSDTVIKNCQLGRVDYFPSWSLKFENIDAEEDLVEFISRWDGFYLLFKNCPGIDDRLLERLSTLPPPGKVFYAPTFRHLEISGSSSASNFSVEALKFLVTARKEHADSDCLSSPMKT
ncbi:hypothetical protein BDN70DRAFT_871050 [Pholiota conissans]|uniref:F-box domain-containing protein n=1 Tax=Pholiota conissans TaxID=109636 RepID=A0A9P6D7D7_9AGAR|nr:hypothetical protein BDN70DRAFT_871050 [Pholiota conissans]